MRSNNISRSLLSSLASHLKFKIDSGHVSLLSVYQKVLDELAAINLADAQGAKVLSRVKWAEEGETSSRYFLNLEKRHGASDWISAMKSPDGSVLIVLVIFVTPGVTFISPSLLLVLLILLPSLPFCPMLPCH